MMMLSLNLSLMFYFLFALVLPMLRAWISNLSQRLVDNDICED
jgi:hypothetical protein